MNSISIVPHLESAISSVIACGRCSGQIEFAPANAGKEFSCPHCGAPVIAPLPPATARPEPVPVVIAGPRYFHVHISCWAVAQGVFVGLCAFAIVSFFFAILFGQFLVR